ncbi:MAG: hypothetical protein ACP5O2_00510 [Bacteroidales bacterium]
MKTTTQLLAPLLLTILFFSGTPMKDAYGQKEDEPPFMLPPQEDLAYEFFGETDDWDDLFSFPFVNPEDFILPDSEADWESDSEFGTAPAPDPRLMKRMERAWRQMHVAMRRLDREMRRLYRTAPEAWNDDAYPWEDFAPRPPLPPDLPGKFPGPAFAWRRGPAPFDTLIENNDTLTRIIILGGPKGDTLMRKSVKIIHKGIDKEGDTVVIERKVVRDKKYGIPGKDRMLRPIDRPIFNRPGMLKVIDLPAEDITRLSKTALAPASSTEPLGIAEIKARPAGKGTIHLHFPARNLSSFEVSLFDENGILLYQESVKKNSGDYDKRLEVESMPPFFLKINQGKKAIIKKIIPDR